MPIESPRLGKIYEQYSYYFLLDMHLDSKYPIFTRLLNRAGQSVLPITHHDGGWWRCGRTQTTEEEDIIDPQTIMQPLEREPNEAAMMASEPSEDRSLRWAEQSRPQRHPSEPQEGQDSIYHA